MVIFHVQYTAGVLDIHVAQNTRKKAAKEQRNFHKLICIDQNAITKQPKCAKLHSCMCEIIHLCTDTHTHIQNTLTEFCSFLYEQTGRQTHKHTCLSVCYVTPMCLPLVPFALRIYVCGLCAVRVQFSWYLWYAPSALSNRV